MDQDSDPYTISTGLDSVPIPATHLRAVRLAPGVYSLIPQKRIRNSLGILTGRDEVPESQGLCATISP